MFRRWMVWMVFLVVTGCGGKSTSEGTTLVEVNGEAITQQQIEEELKALPPQTQQSYEEDVKGFVEQLVVRILFLQEARKRGLDKSEAFKTDTQRSEVNPDKVLIQLLAQDITKDLSVTEEDVQAFVEENRDRLPSDDVQALRPRLEPVILRTKQQATLDGWIEDQMAGSKIVWNTDWVKAQEAKQADNPLDKALMSGKPVVADFGRGMCIPCKKMQPILEALAKEYKGRAEVLIIEIDEYRTLTRRSKIRMIPTQIFFDAEGNEEYRHEGFMAREAIVAKLREMGVE